MSSRSAVFLDRDGVLNRNVLDPATGEYGAPRRRADFLLAPRVLPALQALQSAGFPLFLVSNQPDYAKGKCSLEDLAAVHGRLRSELDAAGIVFHEFYYCYHHPDGRASGYSGPCRCRKPSPYFLLKARDAYGLELGKSWIIGDRVTDIECGRAAGLLTVRVTEDHPAPRKPGETQADFEARDLAHAVQIVLEVSQ